MVEPVDPRQRHELGSLRHMSEILLADRLGLERVDDGLGMGLIIAVTDATDRRCDNGLPLRPLPLSASRPQRHPPPIRRRRLRPEDRHGCWFNKAAGGEACPMIRKINEQSLFRNLVKYLDAKNAGDVLHVSAKFACKALICVI
jgi:hypothetical protein